jgi:predicted ribosomally synthesized peptide with nif11-like leader
VSFEIERLVDAIQNDAGIMEELESLGNDLDATVAWAAEKGYTFSVKELQAHFEAQEELTEDELESVAGGRLTSADIGRVHGSLGLAPSLFRYGVADVLKIRK